MRSGLKRSANTALIDAARRTKIKCEHDDGETFQDHSGDIELDSHVSITTEGNTDATTEIVQPFRLMDLPPEVRLEIYRACLVRPHEILLSRLPALTKEARYMAAKNEGQSPSESSTAQTRPNATQSNLMRNPQRTTLEGTAYLDDIAAAPSRSYRPRVRRTEQPNTDLAASSSTRQSEPERRPPEELNRLRRQHRESAAAAGAVRRQRPQDADPLLVNLLRASKQTYKEARPVLYGENFFRLNIDTALASLSALHQRSRGVIRYLHITIPSHSVILETFSEVCRLSLRYCWKLRIFTISMPSMEGNLPATASNSTVYANAFDILRWLPQGCQVVLEGNVSDDIRLAVERSATLAKNLDDRAYARRQLVSIETDGIDTTR